ncbi:hypothetical protein HMPREF3069_09860 [Achromobacter xylosoxidans]|uniref:hypothetical protein n=1 Tax=Alcaligenes xylosoxydans xylosoxydans TaxID=85698 RepID=UPI0006C628A0|nr:hypothetical protein [Achromobacter xylosoxidans]MCH1990180.1 hypothetical protein [Achromobacter xylosoxidans]MCH1997423.1 hypothetical protein [Achromobacter xylosoxidans]MCH4587060.1 hypothetical protein [Achromobacter xylosoxidans]OFS52785.1 hypothetical protein HMPREF3069_09860 [Achromobacter xylosoxidans]CUJ56263.1 Uncharacterised protein [Achromobacter xylosoxidans]
MDDSATVTQLAKATTPKQRSGVSFPYFSLDKSIDVPRVIHDKAGGRCGRGQLAGLLNYKGIKNGGFLTRISAAKMFGLIEESGDSITLTDRARKILSPVFPAEAQQAKLDAFMSVELYRKVFENFDGHTLPSADGLSNLFLTQYKIVPNQVGTALRNLMDSAESAGLFQVGGKSKLILPIIRAQTAAIAIDPPAQEDSSQVGDQDPMERTNSYGTRARPSIDAELDGVHPALSGLLQTLPPVGSTLGPKRRAALIDAFRHTINFIYPEDEEE